MKEYKEDVTNRYYDMLNSFRADNTIKIKEVEENEIAFDKSFFEIEKDLIKKKNKRYFRDIDLLEELEFYLRHENLKIVSVNRNLKEKDNKIYRLNNKINKDLDKFNDELITLECLEKHYETHSIHYYRLECLVNYLKKLKELLNEN